VSPLGRLLLPRSIRRVAHPLRSAQREITPAPLRRARRTVWSVAHPVKRGTYGIVDVALGDVDVGSRLPAEDERCGPVGRCLVDVVQDVRVGVGRDGDAGVAFSGVAGVRHAS
jgi:hypothetical protein